MKRLIATALILMASPAYAQSAPDGFELPQGPLKVISGSAKTAFFLSVDQTRVENGKAQVLIFSVWEPALVIKEKAVVQMVGRRSLDCKSRSFQDLGEVSYDEAGRVLISTIPPKDYVPPAEPLTPRHMMSFVAEMVCDSRGGNMPTFVGHNEALRAGQAALRAQQQAK